MTGVPPIDPAILRAIFDEDDSPAIPPAVQKGPPLMLRSLIALAAILPLSAASTAAVQPAPATDVARLVEPCRSAARASFNVGDPAIMNAYIDNLVANAERDRDELIACAAYLAGARDMVEGRIIPLDFD